MNKVLFIISILLISFIGLSQDTLITRENVTIIDEEDETIEIYEYLNDFHLKHGNYKLTYSGLAGIYTINGTYKNNLKTGKWLTLVNDTIIFTQKFKAGLLNGKSVAFDKTNKISEKIYKKGLLKGVVKIYRDNQLIIQGKYFGKYFDYNTTDSLHIFNFSDNRHIKINKSNQVAFDSILNIYHIWAPLNRNWLKTGTWKYYSSSGKIIEIQKYNRLGELIKNRVIEKNNLWKKIIN